MLSVLIITGFLLSHSNSVLFHIYMKNSWLFYWLLLLLDVPCLVFRTLPINMIFDLQSHDRFFNGFCYTSPVLYICETRCSPVPYSSALFELFKGFVKHIFLQLKTFLRFTFILRLMVIGMQLMVSFAVCSLHYELLLVSDTFNPGDYEHSSMKP